MRRRGRSSLRLYAALTVAWYAGAAALVMVPIVRERNREMRHVADAYDDCRRNGAWDSDAVRLTTSTTQVITESGERTVLTVDLKRLLLEHPEWSTSDLNLTNMLDHDCEFSRQPARLRTPPLSGEVMLRVTPVDWPECAVLLAPPVCFLVALMRRRVVKHVAPALFR